MIETQLSRRDLARLAAFGALGTLLPSIEAGAAEGPARLHFNENPYGPSPAARKALASVADVAWQYPGEIRSALVGELARLHGVDPDSVLLGNGSSEVLHAAASAFLGPQKPLVVADPTYEALEQYAAALGAPVVKVPLTTSWAHDVAAMVERGAGAGILYLCNPNNPTASITPKASVRQLIQAAPASTVVVVDEAYAHYVNANEYESVIDQIRAHPNLLVTRTFSKVYALAGLRCGYAIGRPETLAEMRDHQSRNSLNAAALLGARASLADEAWVRTSRARNTETRNRVVAALAKRGFEVIPSEANFFMVDLGREIGPVITAMRERGVSVGRPFPPLTRHLRVTVGTEPQMERFLAAFAQLL